MDARTRQRLRSHARRRLSGRSGPGHPVGSGRFSSVALPLSKTAALRNGRARSLLSKTRTCGNSRIARRRCSSVRGSRAASLSVGTSCPPCSTRIATRSSLSSADSSPMKHSTTVYPAEVARRRNSSLSPMGSETPSRTRSSRAAPRARRGRSSRPPSPRTRRPRAPARGRRRSRSGAPSAQGARHRRSSFPRRSDRRARRRSASRRTARSPAPHRLELPVHEPPDDAGPVLVDLHDEPGPVRGGSK